MSIYRGVGGSVDATNNALVEEVNTAALTATTKAAEAATSASQAATSASQAASSAVGVEQYATTATTKASEASTSASQAAASASTASTASSTASSASVASIAARDASQSYRDQAEGFKDSAATSAASASTSAATATTKASSATISASNASASAGNALTSATQSANSASTAITMSNAATAAKNTAVSKASEATSSATSASASAGQAATSATNAANSAITAGDYVTDAGDQVVLATAQADAAAASATDASASAASASTSESNAASSAVEADVSEANAEASATSASQSATASQSSYENALAIYGDINAVNQAVTQAQTAVIDATSQVSLAAAEKVGAQDARDEAESFKDQAYTYSQSAASAVAYQDLTAIAESKAETAVDVFVYDTRKDSDGGAWRKRTQGTSWYNETLNTSTRGSRKEFPAVAVIVAESAKVTIYDGDDPSLPMWMVFNSGINNGYRFIVNGNVKSATGKNGLISIGRNSLVVIDFIGDRAQYIASNTQGDFSGHTVSQRNDYSSLDNGVNWLCGSSIVNSEVNDVAMTVLPNAPIDLDTGLPIPTIAVATNGGVSVIKDDGTVVDALAGSRAFGAGFYGNKCFGVFGYSIVNVRSVYVFDIPSSDINLGNGYSSVYSTEYEFYPTVADAISGYGVRIDSNNATKPDSVLIKDGFVWLGRDKFARVDREPESPSSSLVNHTTSTYNTGWMNGDIKLATLSDTDDTDLVATELVTNGTFDTDTSGWTVTGTGASLTVVNGQLVITRDGTSAVARQTIATEVGKTYVFEIDFVATSGGAQIGLEFGSADSEITGTTGRVSVTHTAISTSTLLEINTYNTASGTLTVDNASVRLAEPDRSVNGNGLQVFGTVQKSPVATGADLVAYSGFSNSNYLQQPYNPDLDFGTGDFCFMGWIDFSASITQFIFDKQDGTGSATGRFNLGVSASGTQIFNRIEGTIVNVSHSFPSGVWTHFVATRRGNTIYYYVNGSLVGSGVNANSASSSYPMRFGQIGQDSVSQRPNAMALIRLSATAPTAEQIAKIYRDEKPLFQEGAQATLHGTSDAVTALAYDDSTDLLHVGTSAGRSVFSGLQRVDNTTDAVGTAISASNGLVVEE